MKNKFKRKTKEKLRRILDFRNWVSIRWITYTYIKYGCYILTFPAFVYVISISNDLAILGIAFLVFPLFVFFFLDSKRSSVAWENPEGFVKSEKVRGLVEKLFFIFFAFLIGSVFLAAGMYKAGLSVWAAFYYNVIVSRMLFLFGGITFAYEMDLVEVFVQRILNRSRKLQAFLEKSSLWQFYEFDVPYKLETRARFCVVLEALGQNPNTRTINKKLPLFKEGIDIYNNHLSEKFGFILRKPEKFYNFTKLAAHTKKTRVINNLKNKLNKLVELMEKKEEAPFEVVKSLKAMVKESASLKNIFDEIEVEPKPFRKWLSTHADSIKVILALVSMIVSISVAIMD